MKAMILAAGFGKRLLPHTKKIPKPLLKVGNKSLIEHNINYLIKNGFNEIIINVSYLGDLIQEHVKEVFPSRNIIFSVEDEPLGTGGGILNAIELLGNNNFLLMNSDIIHSVNISNFPENIQTAHLIGVPNPKHNRNGDFSLRGNHVEVKESNNEYTWCGISVINPIIFQDIKIDKNYFNIWDGVFPKFIEEGKLTGHKSNDFWIDVGTQERLKLANSLYNEHH